MPACTRIADSHNLSTVEGEILLEVNIEEIFPIGADLKLDHEIFASCFMSLDIVQCLLVYSLWKLE